MPMEGRRLGGHWKCKTIENEVRKYVHLYLLGLEQCHHLLITQHFMKIWLQGVSSRLADILGCAISVLFHFYLHLSL